ncbi:hypothetical protein EX895_001235 [Sporisorium graminicola]|uniref:Uncharacterized protein n=1 Tax=Sporisorium graminicola TaxID=280036 RepID=A0A4U7KZX7_9BASI|nr:hypothetical protein EX895_001235 [Sporisorium graminicola]TKY89937.1 hypothetical protein EX895_001235 [Sporisorium graminicola]
MPYSSSPSRSGSSSSPWPQDASHPAADTPSSTSDTPPTGTADKRPDPPAHRKRPVPPRLGLSKPFRSPLKQNDSQSMDTNDASSSSIGPSAAVEGTTAEGSSSSSTVSLRKKRQMLEARLLLLQQANQCLRDDALMTLPQDIARWREAGQLAAQDLWRMTGADSGDWSGSGAIPYRGDYGLESPASASQTHRKRRAPESPEPSQPPLLLRRHRVHSPGAEEQAAALLSIEDPIRHQTSEDSQGAISEGSLPELSELLRRSQTVVAASSMSSERKILVESQRAVTSTSSQFASSSSGKGIEPKWNIGTMLDMLGADKATLAWNVEEEDFQDTTTSAGRSRAP